MRTVQRTLFAREEAQTLALAIRCLSVWRRVHDKIWQSACLISFYFCFLCLSLFRSEFSGSNRHYRARTSDATLGKVGMLGVLFCLS